jgi:hypothetical protein
MAIRVYDNYDFSGETVVETSERLYLGEAKQFAIDHDCTVMIKSFKGWEFKKGPSRADLLEAGLEKPAGLVECKIKSVYII